MKVTFSILNVFGVGGTVRTVVNQANALARAGHEVDILSVVQRGDGVPFPLDPRVRVREVMDGREVDEGASRPGREVPPGENFRHLFTAEREERLIMELQRSDSDVFVATRVALNLLAARYGHDGLVLVAQDHMNFEHYRPPLQEAILAGYPRLDAVVCLTERDADTYREHLSGDARIEVIPNALHTMDVPQADPESTVVVTAGRVVPQKGYDLLINAFAEVAKRHPGWQLRIFGKGDAETIRRLRRMINRRHLYNHVLLMGPSLTLEEELAKASFFVLSSRYEGFPMSLMEALSHGLPVVSFDCPTGPREILTDGVDSLLVPPKNTKALAESICQLIENDALRRKMSRAARENAHSYSPESVRPRWERLFSDLMAQKANGVR